MERDVPSLQTRSAATTASGSTFTHHFRQSAHWAIPNQQTSCSRGHPRLPTCATKAPPNTAMPRLRALVLWQRRVAVERGTAMAPLPWADGDRRRCPAFLFAFPGQTSGGYDMCIRATSSTEYARWPSVLSGSETTHAAPQMLLAWTLRALQCCCGRRQVELRPPT